MLRAFVFTRDGFGLLVGSAGKRAQVSGSHRFDDQDFPHPGAGEEAFDTAASPELFHLAIGWCRIRESQAVLVTSAQGRKFLKPPDDVGSPGQPWFTKQAEQNPAWPQIAQKRFNHRILSGLRDEVEQLPAEDRAE